MRIRLRFEHGITNTIRRHALQCTTSKFSVAYVSFCTPTIKPRLTHFFLFEFSSPDPIERYSFVTVGSDWPSTVESSAFSPQQPSSPIHKRYTNPIKRAWRRRTLRRLIAAARRSYGIVEE